MSGGERQAKYLEQTQLSYALLGEYVARFELIVFSIRSAIEMFAGSPNSQKSIQLLTVRLGSSDLLLAFRALIFEATSGNARSTVVTKKFASEFQSAIEFRNDLVHGTHFIGWTSEDEEDFSNPAIFRLKATAEGTTNRPMDISHSAMRQWNSKLRELEHVTYAIRAQLVLGHWEEVFDNNGTLRAASTEQDGL